MKAIAWILVGCLATSALHGQAHIVKQRAKQLNEQNNARQGIQPAPTGTAGQAPTVTPQPTGPPAPMVASPEILRQHDINTLKVDLANFEPGGAVKEEQVGRLRANLATAMRGSTKATEKLISQLSVNLVAALGQARLSPALHSQMASELVTILNCGGVAPAQLQSTITSVQATLQRGGVERKLAVAVANDLKSIAGEVQRTGGK